jgi:hypothetical protein
MQLIALDDFNDPFAGGGGSLGGTRSLIAAIGENGNKARVLVLSTKAAPSRS